MNHIKDKKSIVSLLKIIQMKIRYGMTLFSVSAIFKKVGIEFTPYCLFQEGINVPEISDFKRISSDYSFELLGPEDMEIIGTYNIGFSEEELLALLSAGGKCIALKYN